MNNACAIPRKDWFNDHTCQHLRTHREKTREKQGTTNMIPGVSAWPTSRLGLTGQPLVLGISLAPRHTRFRENSAVRRSRIFSSNYLFLYSPMDSRARIVPRRLKPKSVSTYSAAQTAPTLATEGAPGGGAYLLGTDLHLPCAPLNFLVLHDTVFSPPQPWNRPRPQEPWYLLLENAV